MAKKKGTDRAEAWGGAKREIERGREGERKGRKEGGEKVFN